MLFKKNSEAKSSRIFINSVMSSNEWKIRTCGVQSPSQLDLISVARKCHLSYEPVSTTEIQSQTLDCFGSHCAHKVFILNFPFKL